MFRLLAQSVPPAMTAFHKSDEQFMNPKNLTANGWTAAIPDGWEDRSLITLVGETDASGFASNIVVTRQRSEPQTSLEEFARVQAELMRQELEGSGGELQIVDERAVDIGGVSSYQRLQRFNLENGRIIQQVQTFFLGANMIYAVTGTATLESFDRAIPAFKKFVETFRLS